jgi:hypothetical protein
VITRDKASNFPVKSSFVTVPLWDMPAEQAEGLMKYPNRPERHGMLNGATGFALPSQSFEKRTLAKEQRHGS